MAAGMGPYPAWHSSHNARGAGTIIAQCASVPVFDEGLSRWRATADDQSAPMRRNCVGGSLLLRPCAPFTLSLAPRTSAAAQGLHTWPISFDWLASP